MKGNDMEIGEKIRKLRTDAGMTQDELAAKLLVTRTAVSKWETGKGWPGVGSLKLIAVACAVATFPAATIGMGGVFDLPPMVATACRWIAVRSMIGYVMLSFAFFRANERMGKRRVFAYALWSSLSCSW